MPLDAQGLTNQLVGHALQTGFFDRVNAYEPPSAPGQGITCALWFAQFYPVPGASALAATAARVEFSARLMTTALSEPKDAIDPNLLRAVDGYVAALSGDFDLGGNVRNVDLLGAHGTPLSGVAGYLDQDGKKFRVILLTIPLIINDVWVQVA